MKLALLSDIHANRQALDACLAHAEAAGAERHAFLGDLVGYGADPSYVVQRVMALAVRGALVIQGNHDLYATQAVGDGKSLGHASVAWTQQQLSEDERAFLAALPLTAVACIMALAANHGSVGAHFYIMAAVMLLCGALGGIFAANLRKFK